MFSTAPVVLRDSIVSIGCTLRNLSMSSPTGLLSIHTENSDIVLTSHTVFHLLHSKQVCNFGHTLSLFAFSSCYTGNHPHLLVTVCPGQGHRWSGWVSSTINENVSLLHERFSSIMDALLTVAGGEVGNRCGCVAMVCLAAPSVSSGLAVSVREGVVCKKLLGGCVCRHLLDGSGYSIQGFDAWLLTYTMNSLRNGHRPPAEALWG